MTNTRSRISPALLLLTLLAGPHVVRAQGPAAEWRTLRTEHYRVHYPAPAEAWTRRVVARLEAVRERVSAEVGYAPAEVTDVLVMDPVARPNGSAWPFLGWPRMVLWTTPPGPESVIGHYRDWGEKVTVHEDVHLAHLLRPSRNPWRRFLARVAPLGPIATRAPRWVSEGYATLLEGKLTGYGRPNSDLRAAILRRWAQLGELPSYGRMSSDSSSWKGTSMAYLVGSAYLEWLVERAGDDSLRALWARMTARQDRSFDAAFTGVFGDPPEKLYNRFRAELTYRAMRVEAEVAPHLRWGELWQELTWTSGPPAVSPDGERLAMVLRDRDEPSRLVVWSTAPDEEAEQRWRERREELVDRDPDDVPAVRPEALPREPLHLLPTRDGAEPYTPRWSGDGRSLVYVRYEPDPEGFLHPDLFRWTPESGRVERLTRGADLRDPDPAPSGGWAVAVRHRHGASALVAVDLGSGAVEPLTEPSVERVYHHPRIAPDGGRLAWVEHRDAGWRLRVGTLGGMAGGRRLVGRPLELPTPPRATVAYPAWSGDGGTVYATVGELGFLDVHAFDLPTGAGRAVTRTLGAALAPAPTPGGAALFFLGLDADGLDLRRLELAAAAPPAIGPLVASTGAEPGELVPAVRPPSPPPVPPFATEELAEPEPYGVGRQELLPLLGGGFAPSGDRIEVGVRGGDVVGRVDYLALASTGEAGFEGGAVTAVWRGLPVALGVHLFTAEERPSEQPTAVPGLGRRLDVDRRGVELTAAWERRDRRGGWRFELGGTLGEVEPVAGESLDREVAFLRLDRRQEHRFGNWRLGADLAAELEVGRTGGDGWDRAGGEVRLTAGRGDTLLGVGWERRRVAGEPGPFERLELGGMPSSILPRSAVGGRVHLPALPVATLRGDEHEGQRVDLRLGALPVRFFYHRHRLWADGGPRGGWLALRGLELRFALAPWPLLRLPGFDLHLGVAEVLDEPLDGEVEWWLGLAWRP